MLSHIRNIWEKNWPEIHAALKRGMPQFVFSPKPKALGTMIPVFCYHTVEQERFRGDLAFLAENGYVTIDVNTLQSHISGVDLAPQNSVVITFDDGAQNLFDVALPLLKEFEMTSIVFIAPGLHPEKDEAQAPVRPLSWETMRVMQDSGHFDFQSHTLEHRYVPRWPELIPLAGAEPGYVQKRAGKALPMEDDFKRAKEMIEEHLQKPATHLAFPKFFGTTDAIMMGKHIGYEGFWWGALPYRPMNAFGSGSEHIVRLEAQFIRRLPGDGRESLATVLLRRYASSLIRLLNVFKGKKK